MGEDEERRVQKLLVQRLRAMGLEVELLPGGRSAVARLPLRPSPLPTAEGPRYPAEVRFATVGAQHVKCLEPLALFHLPLIAIGGCTRAEGIEDRIRAAWAAQGEATREAARRLETLGASVSWETDGTVPTSPLGGDDPRAAARLLDSERVVLPGCGPLSGLPLARVADRVAPVPADLESAVDFEIAVTTRLEALARQAQRVEARRRTARGVAAAEAREDPARRVPVARRVLLVGPLLGRDERLAAGLRGHGFDPARVRGVDEALAAFAAGTFDLVLADADLGRFEGLELIPTLRELPGVSRLPVVLVDDRARPSRKEAARRVGAAGYLAHPVDAARIAAGLARMAEGTRGRRFSRFPRRLAVRFEDETGGAPAFTTALSRLGMFVQTERESRHHAIERCTLALPEIGTTLRVEAQTLYRVDAAGAREPGLGLRFRGFPDGDERTWVEYLRALSGEPSPPRD